jgi:hypothetical protein
MKRFVCVVLLLLAAAAAVTVPAGASTFLALSRQEMVAQADSVIQGRVVEVASFWNEARTAILTEAVVEIEETVLGDAAGYVRIRTFGGQVGNYRIEAHGFPTFSKGERLLLFLEPENEKDGAHRVLGYLQGEYRIRTDARGNEVAVPLFDAGARLLKRDGTEAPAARPVLLEQLKGQLRDAAARIGRPDFR